MSRHTEFLKQTSKDYDIDFETVKAVYNHNDERFYENLELLLEQRKRSDEGFMPVDNAVLFYGLLQRGKPS